MFIGWMTKAVESRPEAGRNLSGRSVPGPEARTTGARRPGTDRTRPAGQFCVPVVPVVSVAPVFLGFYALTPLRPYATVSAKTWIFGLAGSSTVAMVFPESRGISLRNTR